MKDKIELIRAITRSLGLLIPLTTLCGALFVVEGMQEILTGSVMGSAATAAIFYFKKEEEKD